MDRAEIDFVLAGEGFADLCGELGENVGVHGEEIGDAGEEGSGCF